LRIVHVSEPYNTTDCTREVYILSLVERLSSTQTHNSATEINVSNENTC